MDNPTILYQAAKLHHGEIRTEMESWRMAHQVKSGRPGMVKRLVAASGALLKKVFVRPKQETLSPDEHLILNTNL